MSESHSLLAMYASAERKEIIINLGLSWNKTCNFLSTCYGSPITRRKRKKKKEKRKDPAKSQVSKHRIEVYLNFSCCIHADVNKRQITEGKNSSDKIKGKRKGNIPRMINLRFWNRALLLNPKVWRKADRTYRAEELCFYLLSFKRKLYHPWLLPELFLVSFFVQ